MIRRDKFPPHTGRVLLAVLRTAGFLARTFETVGTGGVGTVFDVAVNGEVAATLFEGWSTIDAAGTSIKIELAFVARNLIASIDIVCGWNWLAFFVGRTIDNYPAFVWLTIWVLALSIEPSGLDFVCGGQVTVVVGDVGRNHG